MVEFLLSNLSYMWSSELRYSFEKLLLNYTRRQIKVETKGQKYSKKKKKISID